MIFKLLVLCTMVCSVFAGGSPYLSERTEGLRQTGVTTRTATANAKSVIDPLVTKVRNVVFRHRPDLIPEMLEFQRQYPKEFELIDSKNLDRGFSMSVRDPFFVSALSTVAQLVDTGRDVVVGDFGFGAGDTTFLFAVTGASVMGIENQISPDEYRRSEELYSYYTTLAKRIGSEYIRGGNREHYKVCKRMEESGLSLQMKFRTDARLLHEDSDIKANIYSVLFMGNFPHMFDPHDAEKLIRNQALRMLRRGGNVFASVDGVAAQDGSADAYLQADREHKKFPSAMSVRTQGGFSEGEGEIRTDMKEILFTHAEIDEEGKMLSECRRKDITKWYYCGPDLKSEAIVTGETPIERIPLYAKIDRTICLYDSKLIDFVFPKSDWDVTVRKLDIYGQENSDLRDHEVAKWNIMAEKK